MCIWGLFSYLANVPRVCLQRPFTFNYKDDIQRQPKIQVPRLQPPSPRITCINTVLITFIRFNFAGFNISGGL